MGWLVLQLYLCAAVSAVVFASGIWIFARSHFSYMIDLTKHDSREKESQQQQQQEAAESAEESSVENTTRREWICLTVHSAIRSS